MDWVVKTYSLAIAAILMISAGQELFANDLNALQIGAVRFDNESDALQLHISWNASSEESDRTLYEVKVYHIFSEKCNMEHTNFANQQDIACAPIITETEDTSVLLPRDPRALDKHVCLVLPYCSYKILVNPLEYNWRLSEIFHVPECVQEICSCYYEGNLPNVTFSTYISENHLIVNWTLLGDANFTEKPSDVKLEYVAITVRRGKNENLLWGGQESSKKIVHAAISKNGSNKFDVQDFEGDKSIFVIQVRLYDSRRCFSEAAPQRVFIPNIKDTAINKEEQSLGSSSTQLISLAIIAISVGAGIAYGIILLKRKRKPRRVVTNWRGGHDAPCSNNHLETMQMEENHLYTDWEVVEARARGEADLLEVPHSTLRIGREIGKGAFGRVFIASATKLPGYNGPRIVAVKQLKKCSKQTPEFEEFLDEIAMMKQVGRHPNIVTLLGCCTIKDPLSMIMEYVGCGDLLEYLRKIRAKHLARVALLEAAANQRVSDTVSIQRSISNHSNSTVFGSMLKYMDVLHTSSSNSDPSYITQPDTVLRPSLTETLYTTLSVSNEQSDTSREPASIEYVLDHKELHDFARQIACGMQHLEEKQITHRDLAARNILIDERKTLKISDFGLSRTGIYVNTRNKKVPLRWLSIEAMRDNLYSSKSDVWAFGIVLWEIGTLGGYPYPTVSNHELLPFLHNGNRLERPENCSTEVYELMLNCWKAEPDDRPSFKEILKSLEPHKRIYIDFNEIQPTYVFPPTSQQTKQEAPNHN